MYRHPPSLTSSTTSGDGWASDNEDNDWEGMDDTTTATTAPRRPLTTDELSQLQALIKGTLHLSNSPCAIQAEEDATDLVNFACDLLLDDGGDDMMTVRAMLDELAFMELEICGPHSLAEMGKRLVKFLAGLEDGTTKAAKNRHTMMMRKSHLLPIPQDDLPVRRNSLRSQLMQGEHHVTIDLSAKTAAVKKKEEMKQLFQRGKSLKDRMTMYNDQGTLRGSFQNDPNTTFLVDDVDDGLDLSTLQDQAALEEHRNEELMAIMDDVSLTQQEQTDQMKGVRAKYGLAEMKMKIAAAASTCNTNNPHKGHKKNTDNKKAPSSKTSKNIVSRAERELRPIKGRRSSIDLSAKSAAAKKAQELASLKTASTSLKDRMSMYENAIVGGVHFQAVSPARAPSA